MQCTHLLAQRTHLLVQRTHLLVQRTHVLILRTHLHTLQTPLKVLAATQWDAEISREHGMPLEEVFLHDYSHTSSLFDGCFTYNIVEKSNLITLLEMYLTGGVEIEGWRPIA